MHVHPERQSVFVPHEGIGFCWQVLAIPQHRQLLPASQKDGKDGQPASFAFAQGGRGGIASSQGRLTAPASGGTFVSEPEQSQAPPAKMH